MAEEVRGGHNSRVWGVGGAGTRFAAKLVRAEDSNLEHFEAGLRVAARLDSPAMPTGAPLRADSGDYTVQVAGGRLGLMRWVSGTALDGTRDAARLGATLADLHTRAAHVPAPPQVPRWPWTWLTLDGLPVLDPRDPELVGRAVALARPERFTLGMLHGDPTPEAFLAVNGGVGVIDWASVLYGPVLYDVATMTLVLQRRGARPAQVEELVAAYARRARMRHEEILRIDMLRGLRLSAEMVYHTVRIGTLTGQHVLVEDHTGLRRSRQELIRTLAAAGRRRARRSPRRRQRSCPE